MPLTRHRIRNEYRLADSELYRAADKDDPEALLEGVAMAGLVGVLRQLGDLAEFAAEIFHDLHEEVMATATRGHGLVVRVQQLEAEFSSIEKAFLSQTSHSFIFYNTGIIWHPNVRMDQNLIVQGDLPRFVMDSYEECRGPPRLFLLDRFDVAGAGSCLKRYTDPSFFKVDPSSFGMMNSEGQREKKTRKVKKKGSRWRNGETPEVIPTSNVKLQQLFLEGSVENYINDPAHRVKLKRRLNGFPFDSKPGKSYMEKFLETSPTDHSTVHEISVNSSTLEVPSNITGVSGIEILEISTVSPEKDSLRRKSGPRSSPCVEDTKQRQSMVGLREEGNYGISELTKPNPNSEASIALSLHEELDEKEIMVVGERKVEGSANGYQFGDIASEVENYTDALTTMDSEMETETECRAKDNVGFLNIEPQVSYEEQQGHLAHFSDDQSMGNPTATDDGNSSFRKRIFSFPYNDSPSNLVENTPSDGDFSAKVFLSSNHNELHTEHIYQEENRKSTGDNLACASDVSNVTSLTKDDILCDLSADNNPVDELDGEDPNVLSHSSLHLSSILGLATATKSNEILLCNLLQAEFTEEECKKFSVDSQIDSPKSVASHREEQKLGSALPELETRVPDVKPDSKVSEVDETMSIEELSGDMRRAECMEEECMKFTVDSQIDSPKSVASHREEQTLDSALPELEIHIPDVKTDEKVSEVDEMKNSEDLLADILQAECTEEDCTKFSVDSRIDSPKSVASHREEQTPGSALPELETCVPDVKTDRKVSEVDETRSEDLVGDMPPQAECTEEECTKFSVDSQIDSPKSVVGVSYCSEGDLYGALNAADGEELCGFSSEMGMVGKNAANVKFPDLPLSPGVHLDVDDAETETIHSEAMIVANVANTHDDNNRDNGRSLTTCATKLQDLRQNGLEIYEVCSPENFQESGIEKVDQQIVASSDLDYVTCNTVPCDDSKSELLNNVTAASMAALSRNSLHVAESHSDLFSSHQNDLDSKSKSPKQINVIESIEDAAPSPPNHIAEMRTPLEGHADASSEFCAAQLPCQTWKSEFLPQLDVSEQATDPTNSVVPPFGLLPEIAEINLGEMPPLPPLPPVQWRMGKVQRSSLAPERDLVGHYLYPSLQIFPFTADEKAELDHLGTEGENTRPLNPSLPLSAAKVENSQQGYENLAGNKDHSAPLSLQVPTMVNCGCNEDDNPFLALPTISNGSSQHGFLATERGTEHPTLNPFSPSMDVEDPISIYPPGSLEEKLIQSQHQLPSQMSSEDKKIQSTFMVSEGEAANYPETSFPRPDKQEDQPKHFFYYPEGETFLSSPAPLVPSEDGKPNGIRQIKLPRPRNPLIDAVVALDKSKLKKVTDRVRPKIGQELDERNSLLEQIRTKSFNLKPAVKTRPSNKGPKTNLKVAAILEKANAIRQALAGSDEDDDDSDGWSDS